MATITYRRVKDSAMINETFLQCYAGEIVKLIEYKNGRMDLKTSSGIIYRVDGTYTSEYNGWNYTTKKILSRPIKPPTP